MILRLFASTENQQKLIDKARTVNFIILKWPKFNYIDLSGFMWYLLQP